MKKAVRILCFAMTLIILMAMPVWANESSTYSSLFIASYDSFITNPAGNTLKIWFDVVGNGAMDEIGAMSIELDRSSNGRRWVTVQTFLPEDYPQMVCRDTGIAYDYVSCTVEYGYYYRAYVTMYASDSRGTGTVYDYAETIYLPVP